ncbi:DUF4338 domain-containing protein [Candidatus Kaiserbacteria bacterium]|nr:DUF4338 domain-containing protein [Candidatus Kaiserbacteria bacterium]
MPSTLTRSKELKREIIRSLHKQGYRIRSGVIQLKENTRDSKRKAHIIAKAERILAQEKFVTKHKQFILSHLPNGKDINVAKIKPRLIEVKAGSKWEIMFRWWSLVWWSLPNERAYGRQMRFLVWDSYHKAPIGLIGLQSPILSWAVRDGHLGISAKDRDYWVNQSLSAQRLGALPPYNQLLGGKLVASLLTSDTIRRAFEKKYRTVRTVMQKRKIPARLLFVTTTGGYGKSSIYARLKYKEKMVADFIGYSNGIGSFHISNLMYENLLRYLESKNIDTARGYGSGPSRKIKLIDQAMKMIGFEKGTRHTIKRGVYLFSLVDNLKEVIRHNKKPKWIKRSITDLTDSWKTRWAIPRSQRDVSYKDFTAAGYIRDAEEELEGFKNTYQALVRNK